MTMVSVPFAVVLSCLFLYPVYQCSHYKILQWHIKILLSFQVKSLQWRGLQSPPRLHPCKELKRYVCACVRVQAHTLIKCLFPLRKVSHILIDRVQYLHHWKGLQSPPRLHPCKELKRYVCAGVRVQAHTLIKCLFPLRKVSHILIVRVQYLHHWKGLQSPPRLHPCKELKRYVHVWIMYTKFYT